jgi:hypothetical protein
MADSNGNSLSNPASPRASTEILRSDQPEEADEISQISPADSRSRQAQLQTHRLFGTYMNSAVTYQDAAIAWLLTDDFLSRMSSTVYERFAGEATSVVLRWCEVTASLANPSTARTLVQIRRKAHLRRQTGPTEALLIHLGALQSTTNGDLLLRAHQL